MNDLKRILLVDDSDRDVELTLAAFAEQNIANAVDVARDGAEALEYLQRRGAWAQRPAGNPVVVLLDIKMPKVDGLEVLQKMRGSADLKHVPVVMLTSSREERDLIESYRLGVNAYVVKPVDFSQFVDAVKQIGAFWAVINQPPPGSVNRTN